MKQFHSCLICIIVLIGLPVAQCSSSSQHRGVITNIIILQIEKWKSKFSKLLKYKDKDKVSWQSGLRYGRSGNQIWVSHSLSSTQITSPRSALSGMVLLLLQYETILTKTTCSISCTDLRTVQSHFHSEESKVNSSELSKWSQCVCLLTTHN